VTATELVKKPILSSSLRRRFAAVALAAIAVFGRAAYGEAAPTLAEHLERVCPCAGPALGGSWPSQRPYHACVRRELRSLVRVGATTAALARRAHRAALGSECGVRTAVPWNVQVCGAGAVLACETAQTAHVDDCVECDAALAGELVECARYAGPAGEDLACGENLPAVRGSGRAVERRTAIDCGSCLEKLGTPKPAGVTCLRASCGLL
jgi:hypothetical protein